MAVAPQINDAVDNVAPNTGVVPYGGYTNDTSPVIQINLGDQLVPGDTLTLEDNGAVAATVALSAADVARGTENVQLCNLAPEWHLLTAVVSDQHGDTVATSNPWALGVSTATPAAPVIVGATDTAGAVANGGHTADATPTIQLTETGLPPPPSGPPGHAPYGGPALLSGDLYLYDGKTQIADVKLGFAGPINVTPDTPLSPGVHVLTAVVVDRAGDASAPSAPFTIVVGGGGETTQPSDAADQLQASASATQVSGMGGDDTIVGWGGGDVLRGGMGNDSIAGGTGFNDINGNQGADTIVGVSTVGDWLVGGQGNDSITAAGSSAHNLIYGNLGNDTLVGGSGGDILRGGQGDDSVVGGIGNDWLSGDLGHNTLTGGAGADVFHASAAGVDLVTDFSLAQGDRVQLDPGVSYTVVQQGSDTVIELSTGGQMTLQGVAKSTLASGWIFEA